MTQHGGGGARFSSGSTASVVATGTRLPRPELTEAMTACTQAVAALRQADACLMAVKDKLYAMQEAENGH